MNKTRKEFLKEAIQFGSSLFVLATFLIGDKTFAKNKKPAAELPSLPEDEVPVDEKSPIAAALGFHHDASQTDFQQYPNRKKSIAQKDFCNQCEQFTRLNSGWGKCSILSQGVVSGQGWCGAFKRQK